MYSWQYTFTYSSTLNKLIHIDLIKCAPFTVEVYKDCGNSSVISNALVLVNNPPKENPIPEHRRPPCDYMEDTAKNLKQAHVDKLDPNYIPKIESILCIKTNDEKK